MALGVLGTTQGGAVNELIKFPDTYAQYLNKSRGEIIDILEKSGASVQRGSNENATDLFDNSQQLHNAHEDSLDSLISSHQGLLNFLSLIIKSQDKEVSDDSIEYTMGWLLTTPGGKSELEKLVGGITYTEESFEFTYYFSPEIVAPEQMALEA